MTRWPRRAKPLPADMPQPLREFVAADWGEWLLKGPDPAQEGLGVPLAEFYALPHPVEREVFRGTAHPITTEVVTVGIGDRPALVAEHRRLDAHRRWTAARRGWLEEHVSPEAGFDFWIDAIAEEHRMTTGRRAASG